MVRRSLIALTGVFALYCLYALAQGIFGFNEEPQPVQAQKRAPSVAPWNGQATHQFNLTFNQRGSSLTVARAAFKGLQYPKASVYVDISVPAVNGRKPKWIKPQAFFGYQPVRAQRYAPKLKISPQGAVYAVRLIFSGIPSGALGPTCQQMTTTSNDPLSLNFPGLPGPNFALALSAPPAPPGHCFDEPNKAKPRKVLVFQRVRVGNKGKVRVFGRVSGPVKRIRLQVGKRGFKTVAKPVVHNHRFTARFRLSPGKYRLRVKYGGRYWHSKVVVRGGKKR